MCAPGARLLAFAKLQCGLKARDVTAWGEARRAEPQVMGRTNPAALQGRDKALHPSDEVDRLIESTPTAPLTQADLERLDFNWQDCLDSLCAPTPFGCNDNQLLLQIP
ncbi:MAG: hypothetical protein ABSF95_23890 [Verrucomicrobiota bacterium]